MNLRSRVLAYTAMAGLGLLTLAGCSIASKPVEAKYYFSPSTAHNGENVNWGVKIISSSEDLRITSVTNYQEIISGVGVGETANNNITTYLTTKNIPANSTQTIIDRNVIVYNPYGVNETIEGNVTVNFDNGTSVTSNRASLTVLHQ